MTLFVSWILHENYAKCGKWFVPAQQLNVAAVLPAGDVRPISKQSINQSINKFCLLRYKIYLVCDLIYLN